MTDNVSSCSACGKSAAADPLGDHQVGCGGNGDRIHRHDAIWDALYSAAQSAALAPREEVPTLIPGTRSRPADIFLPNWCRGRPAALDVTVISTMQPLTQLGAASEKRYALKLAEERKMVYSSQCRMQRCRGVVCSPCCEVVGRLEPGSSPTNLQNRQTSGSETWYHPCRSSFTFVPVFVHLFVERKCNYVGSPPSVSLNLD